MSDQSATPSSSFEEVYEVQTKRIKQLERELAESQAEARRLLDRVVGLIDEREKAEARCRELEAVKDGAYLERNQCVSALTKLFPSRRTKTAIEGWSKDWHGCVYIELPTGQVSWHFHDSHAYLFAHVPEKSATWDGHDTVEKYRRLAAIAALSAQPQQEPVAWMQSDHLNKLARKHCGSQSMLVRASDHQLQPDYVPLYTAPPSGVREPDAAHLQTIDERDAAEEAVSDIYYRITGRSPEWSNLFGFEQAIDEIQDAFDLVRAVAKSNTAPQSGVREGMLLDALQRAQRVMHGEGVEDQGEAWDKCAQILDEAITRAAEQVNAEEKKNGKV